MSKDCNIRCAREKPFYHFDQPTTILAEAESPRQLEFQAPDAPSGTYLIVVYDGSENGFHYTWEFFKVLARTRRPIPSHDETTFEATWVLMALCVLTGMAAGWFLRRQFVH